MRIVVAPDSFKGSASASEVADALARGLSRALPNGEFIKVPMADGGEGTVHALVAATNGRLAEEEVCGPLGRKVRAFYGITGDGTTAVIEMAAASGLTLVRREERDPRRRRALAPASSFAPLWIKDAGGSSSASEAAPLMMEEQG